MKTVWMILGVLLNGLITLTPGIAFWKVLSGGKGDALDYLYLAMLFCAAVLIGNDGKQRFYEIKSEEKK